MGGVPLFVSAETLRDLGAALTAAREAVLLGDADGARRAINRAIWELALPLADEEGLCTLPTSADDMLADAELACHGLPWPSGERVCR